MIVLKFFLDHVMQTFKCNRKRRDRSPRKEKGHEEMVVVSLQRGEGPPGKVLTCLSLCLLVEKVVGALPSRPPGCCGNWGQAKGMNSVLTPAAVQPVPALVPRTCFKYKPTISSCYSHFTDKEIDFWRGKRCVPGSMTRMEESWRCICFQHLWTLKHPTWFLKPFVLKICFDQIITPYASNSFIHSLTPLHL